MIRERVDRNAEPSTAPIPQRVIPISSNPHSLFLSFPPFSKAGKKPPPNQFPYSIPLLNPLLSQPINLTPSIYHSIFFQSLIRSMTPHYHVVFCLQFAVLSILGQSTEKQKRRKGMGQDRQGISRGFIGNKKTEKEYFGEDKTYGEREKHFFRYNYPQRSAVVCNTP